MTNSCPYVTTIQYCTNIKYTHDCDLQLKVLANYKNNVAKALYITKYSINIQNDKTFTINYKDIILICCHYT